MKVRFDITDKLPMTVMEGTPSDVINRMIAVKIGCGGRNADVNIHDVMITDESEQKEVFQYMFDH